MNPKKIIIAASIVIVLLVSGYLIYTQLAPKTPTPTPVSNNTPGTVDLSTFDIPDEPTAVIRLFRTVNNEVILADNSKRTLYFYASDEEGKSNCYDICAANWPPLTIQSGDSVVVGSGIPKGTTTIIERTDGKIQIAYKGRPLYTREGDQNPGDMTGSKITSWEVAKP